MYQESNPLVSGQPAAPSKPAGIDTLGVTAEVVNDWNNEGVLRTSKGWTKGRVKKESGLR